MLLSPTPHILYVDDNEDSCEMITVMLRMADASYCITTLTSSQQALPFIEEASVDLYILDYSLPEMSGVELCRRIREWDKDTPIIFFSGRAHEKDKKDGIQAGANEYLTKPNDIDQLTKCVKRLLAENGVISESNSPVAA